MIPGRTIDETLFPRPHRPARPRQVASRLPARPHSHIGWQTPNEFCTDLHPPTGLTLRNSKGSVQATPVASTAHQGKSSAQPNSTLEGAQTSCTSAWIALDATAHQLTEATAPFGNSGPAVPGSEFRVLRAWPLLARHTRRAILAAILGSFFQQQTAARILIGRA